VALRPLPLRPPLICARPGTPTVPLISFPSPTSCSVETSMLSYRPSQSTIDRQNASADVRSEPYSQIASVRGRIRPTKTVLPDFVGPDTDNALPLCARYDLTSASSLHSSLG